MRQRCEGSIFFGDGIEFTATSPTSAPLLTVSAPVDLNFTSGASRIQGRLNVKELSEILKDRD